MMDAIQRAVPVPQAEVIMHGASGRQILGQRAPLAAGAQNVHHAVDHLADSDAPFAAAGLARRDQRLDMRPFRIGQVARITQFVVAVAVERRSETVNAGGCRRQRLSQAMVRQSTWGTSRANSPPQRITADSALQEGPPDNRFIRLIKSPDGHLESVRRLYCRITEFSEHESNGRELDEGERVAVEVLPVLGQSAAAVEPGDGAFDHPTPGLDDEALHPIGSLDDLGLEIGQDAGQGAVKDRALIGAVGEQFPEKGKQTEQGRQQRETAVAILNVGGGDDAVQQQALRIDQNMPLLALDQLAGIEAVAVDASPPFSALFTL